MKSKVAYPDAQHLKNKHRGVGTDQPDLRRICPECGKKNFMASTLYGRVRVVENGKTVRNDLIRQDAGSFKCYECGYYEDY